MPAPTTPWAPLVVLLPASPPPQNRTDGLRTSQARHSRRRGAPARAGQGPFEVELLFRRPDKNRMGDLDNGIKPLMDWMQRVELIEDDRTYPGRNSST